MSKTLKSGNWSDPSIWDSFPTASSLAEILHQVTIDVNTSVAGVNIVGELIFSPTSSASLSSSKNIVVTGKLSMNPLREMSHAITFIGIDENRFVGNTDTILDSDVGLWVTEAGQLDIQGSHTDSWSNLDPRSNMNEIINSATKVTRNVTIQGTINGYSHIFIKSSKPQKIRYATLQFMGPRKDINSDGVEELILGRYACHFHHSDFGSVGSLIEGCVAKNCDNHVFVAHGSHGITMRRNIVHDVLETPFWYDIGHKTNNLRWEDNLVAYVDYIPRSLDPDGAPTFGAGGFLLGFGDGNVCNGNIVAFTSGDVRGGGAYIWPEVRNDNDVTAQLESSWEFKDNVAYGCPSGISVWQNNNHHHIIENFKAYYCDTSIFHGAYQNHYNYQGGELIGGPIELRAASTSTNRVRFENIIINADGGEYCVVANEGPLNGVAPILFRNCRFLGYTKKAIIDQNPGPGVKNIDVIDCGLPSTEYQVSSAAISAETIRVQEPSFTVQIRKSGVSGIPRFAPSLWGTGTGLIAEYYSGKFGFPLIQRVEPNVNIFDITHPQVHYLVPKVFSVRWTGFIVPQTTENYTFICTAGGGVKLWIDGKLLIDRWSEKYPGDIQSTSIALVAGRMYSFKLEYFNEDDRSQCLLDWQTPSLKREAIPMSQLYPLGDIVGTTTTTTSSSTSTSTTRRSTTTTTTTTRATTSTTTTTSTTAAGPKVIIEILDNGTWRYK
jgi:hypothetical protein